MTSPHRVTTPLRRISHGSISALRQSQSHLDGAGTGGDLAASQGAGGVHGMGGSLSLSTGPSAGGAGLTESPLAFLRDAMADLSHETSIFQSNLEEVNVIQEALGEFNENFSMYQYGLKMNAFCVEWPEAPGEEHFERVHQTQDLLRAQRQHQSSILAGHAYNFAPAPGFSSPSDEHEAGPGSNSLSSSDASTPVKSVSAPSPARAATSTGAGGTGPSKSKASAAAPPSALKKAAPKAQITVAQKKQRLKFAADIIETLPLEYRGGRDPKPRKIAESVILALIAAGSNGVRSAEIASPPDLPAAKVNITLLALVQAKHAVRTSSSGGAIFTLDPARHPRLPP